MTPADSAIGLAGLRGYHLPDAVGWWPPAPGWWLLLGLSLVLGGLFVWWGMRRRRREAAARQAERELARLRAALDGQGDPAAFVRGLSRLLRRYALARFPGLGAAALTGDDWLAFLDTHGGGGRFRHGPGRQLADAPYRPTVTAPVGELAELVQAWIRHNREVRP